MFVWLISHQPAVFFSQNKPTTDHQPTILNQHHQPATSQKNMLIV
jgi:hypothetical protein